MRSYKIFGIGGAGGNMVNALINGGVSSDRLYAINTDSQSLALNRVENKFQIGPNLTRGLGAHADPDVGKAAFNESKELFEKLIINDSLYVIIGGFGGGTFTGVAPALTELIVKNDRKALVIGTTPFLYEGKKRIKTSLNAINQIKNFSDNVILISNDRLRDLFGNLPFNQAFDKADQTIGEIIKKVAGELSLSAGVMGNDLLNEKAQDIMSRLIGYGNNEEYLISPNSKIILTDTTQELLSRLNVDRELVFQIAPRKFEELIQYIYYISGYETELTPTSRDNGADLLVWTPPPIFGEKFLTIVQAKRYGLDHKVGSDEVRELIGSKVYFNADKAQLITTSSFSKPAIHTAKPHKIDLSIFQELNSKLNSIITGRG